MSFELGEKEEYVRLATENLEKGVLPRRRQGWRLFVIAAVAHQAERWFRRPGKDLCCDTLKAFDITFPDPI